jgi:GAF domain-containing protein
VAARPSVRFHPLPPAKIQPFDSSAAYQELGHKLADVVHEALRTQRLPEPTAAVDRHWEWDVAPRIVEITRAGGSEVLQRIADEAKAEFGVAVATVSILDGDRLFYTVNTDRLPNSIPSDLAHCKVVVDSDEPLVVPNSSNDARFRDNPLIDVTHAAFYAGFPLHAVDGHTVGALCLLNGLPKSERSVPIAALERFALQAQDELRRLEIEARQEAATPVESLV